MNRNASNFKRLLVLLPRDASASRTAERVDGARARRQRRLSMKMLFTLAALLGFFAVAVGAFAAHGLKGRLSPEAMAWMQTGVQYHGWHALAALIALVFWRIAPAETGFRLAAIAFLVGVVVFSGSLYVMALTGMRWLGAVTPIGGTAFLLGWIALAHAGFRSLP